MLSIQLLIYCTTEHLLQHARNILKIPVMSTVEDFVGEARLTQWKAKALHGEFFKKVVNFQWLMCGCLKIQTEVQVVAAQDQVLPVQAMQNCICGLMNCRVCELAPEYLDHVLSSCTPYYVCISKDMIRSFIGVF